MTVVFFQNGLINLYGSLVTSSVVIYEFPQR